MREIIVKVNPFDYRKLEELQKFLSAMNGKDVSVDDIISIAIKEFHRSEIGREGIFFDLDNKQMN